MIVSAPGEAVGFSIDWFGSPNFMVFSSFSGLGGPTMLKRFYACPAVASILLSAMLLSYSGGLVLGATPAADSSIEAPLQSDPAQRLKLLALFEASWQDRMRRSPEWATFNGDNRYGDRLSDVSAAQQAANFALMREELAKARSIDRSALAVKDRTSLDMFIQGNLNQLAYEPLVGFRRLTLGAISGFHLSGFKSMPNSNRVNSACDAFGIVPLERRTVAFR